MGTLSVRENLLFSASLRLDPQHHSSTDKRIRVGTILEELGRKQETDLMTVVRQVMELDKQNRQQEARVTEAESKYSEINNRVEILQLQGAQSITQTSSGELSHHRLVPVQIQLN